MRRCLLALALGLTLACLPAIAPGHAARAGSPTAHTQEAAGAVRLEPDRIDLHPGEQATVDIWLDGVADYYGIDLRVTYDPAVVQIPAGEATPRWEVFDGNPTHHFLFRNVADNEAGLLQYIIVNLNPAQPFTGTGRVCSLTLVGVAPGNTQLLVTFAKGTTRGGTALWPTHAKATVFVRDEMGAGAWWHGYLPRASRP